MSAKVIPGKSLLHRLETLLCIATLATVAASVAAVFATAWWILELFAHFRAQYAAALLLALAVLALRRRWLWCAATLPALALNAAALAAYWPRSATADPPAGERLTVMSVNLNNDHGEPAGFLEIVEEASPDLVLLVEFSPGWDAAAERLAADYPHQVKAPRSGVFGIALLSRFPLIERRVFELVTTPAIDVRIERPGGRVRVIGVHLVPPTSADRARARNRQLEALATLTRRESDPLIVLGDFNATPYSPFFSAYLRDSELRDSRSARGWDFSWPTFLPILGIPIDHCLVSEQFAVLDHRRGRAFGSDHYPVTAELVLRNSP